MHKSLALGLLAGGIVASFGISLYLGVAFFIAAGFSYYLGARVEGEE